MTDKTPERIWADEKFWPYVDKRGDDECWPWTGTVMGRGYGSLRPKKGENCIGAHRFSWALHNGRWQKKGLVIMHSCDNPLCVNPSHLSEATQSENIQDCVQKGRHVPYHPPLKTHCKNGHEYTAETTEYVNSRGVKVRRCKICRTETNRKWRERNGR